MSKKVFQLENLRSKEVAKQVRIAWLIFTMVAIVSMETILYILNFNKLTMLFAPFILSGAGLVYYWLKIRPYKAIIIHQNRLIAEITITRPKFDKLKKHLQNKSYINIDNQEYPIKEFWNLGVTKENITTIEKFQSVIKDIKLYFGIDTIHFLINTGGYFEDREKLPKQLNLINPKENN